MYTIFNAYYHLGLHMVDSNAVDIYIEPNRWRKKANQKNEFKMMAQTDWRKSIEHQMNSVVTLKKQHKCRYTINANIRVAGPLKLYDQWSLCSHGEHETNNDKHTRYHCRWEWTHSA